MAPGRHLSLGRGDLAERAAQVQRAGPPGCLGGPRDGAGEREVHLADSRAVAEPGQRAPVPGGQPRPGEADQRPRRHIEQHRPGPRQVGQRLDPLPGGNLASGRHDRVGHGRGDRRAPAGHDRPADAVCQRGQQQSHPCRRGRGQRHHRVRRGAGQQRSGLVGAHPPGDGGRGSRRVTAEAGQRGGRAGRSAHRGEHGGGEYLAAAGQRADQAAVGGTVGAEAVRGLADRAAHRGGPAAVQRVREHHVGMGEPDPTGLKAESQEERRRQRQRVRGRADVVPVAGQRQFLGAAAAARRHGALDQAHPQAGGGQRDRSREAVRPAADHDRVGLAAAHERSRQSAPCSWSPLTGLARIRLAAAAPA